MSFGFSASDVIALLNLARGVYKGWKRACGDYAEITRELDAFKNIIARVEVETRAPSSLLQRDPQALKECRKLLKGCSPLLEGLRKILREYSSLGTDQKSTWERIRFQSSSLQSLRDELVRKTTCLHAYLSALGFSSLGRIENGMSSLGRIANEIFPQLLDKMTDLARQSRNRNASLSSLTTYDNDDKTVWQEFRRDLCTSGFRSSDIRQFAPALKTFLRQLQSTGYLDEENPQEFSSSPSPQRSPSVDRETQRQTPFTDIWIQLANENQYVDEARVDGKGKQRSTSQYSLPNNLPSENIPEHDSQPKHPSTEHLQSFIGNKRLTNEQPQFTDNEITSGDDEDCSDLYSESSGDEVEAAGELLAEGSDISISCTDIATQLFKASLNGRFQEVDLLLMRGVDITATDEEGWTALHYASLGGHAEIVELLMANGAEFTITDEEGWAPLHCASDRGHVDVTILLLRNGADVTAMDKSMITPLERAKLREHVELAELLQESFRSLGGISQANVF
ncbi:uncharacterized protein Z520_11585 [Fonsecaea multimorphosa CBS 102226]|uniref:Uncharacterized protein n=1 Tax=Fonsecaea multimorphosa CBS 102226 TaxID=1442371 RepID=A0A0D2K8Q3_9EURO|nr:uncharacterized protein Z520_11585 [Fonsecaea multimorphosa CBS 102226]KIX92733.1 hypothetical protein Z520_11585 [Fonsecaea multimorphosa CBS 102226]OAL17975.1 hypothetical protein AYO22_11131 [Fonsecaea multimorphosa]